MSPLAYKILHITGVLMIFLSYGALIARVALKPDDKTFKKLGNITSGIGLLIVLVSGMGMIHKLGYGYPTWVIVKFAIWGLLGGLTAVANRKAEVGKILWFALILVGALAAYTAVMKPF